MAITVVGLDLAKNVFQAHGADAEGRTVLRRRLRRSEVLQWGKERGFAARAKHGEAAARGGPLAATARYRASLGGSVFILRATPDRASLAVQD
jgi:hypothetical protein